MIRQTWKMAWSAVLTNKLRTFLTMLGVIIGVAALVVLVSIADGATNSVSDRISSMGSDFLMVQVLDDKENPIRLSELAELFDDDTIGAYAPYGRTSVTGQSGYTEGNMTVYGTTGAFFDIMDQELLAGRFLKNTDIDNNSYVIVVTSDTAVEFFGRSDAEGETLEVDGKSFLVVGVLAEDDSLTGTSAAASISDSDSSDSSDTSESVDLEGYIPYSTYSRLADNALDITLLYISAGERAEEDSGSFWSSSSAGSNSLDETEAAVENIMLERFGSDEDAYSIQNQSEVMEAMEEVGNTLALMLGGIAGISLLVGGIGIMNIMLVSVTERTREIGIRKAIGASYRSILLQFLLEAVIVSLAGCLIGVGFSWAALKSIGIVMGDSMSLAMNLQVVGVAIAFSGVIGVVFGLYPAAKAAGKKPIDALRYSG